MSTFLLELPSWRFVVRFRNSFLPSYFLQLQLAVSSTAVPPLPSPADCFILSTWILVKSCWAFWESFLAMSSWDWTSWRCCPAVTAESSTSVHKINSQSLKDTLGAYQHMDNSKQTWTWHKKIKFLSQLSYHLEVIANIYETNLFLVVDRNELSLGSM